MEGGSFDNVVPITREVLREYYSKFPIRPTPESMQEVLAQLKAQCKELGITLENGSGKAEDGLEGIAGQAFESPHKMDENIWRNRQEIEEIQFLFADDQVEPVETALKDHPEAIEKAQWDEIKKNITAACQESFVKVESFQKEGMKKVQSVISTFLPNDWRMSVVRAQQDRSEANREAQIAALVEAGGSIREKYDLYWQLQLQRRETLVQIGNASGVYKAILQYIGGVPQVLLDFIKTVNDNNGPMDELRQKYGPQLYFFTEYINTLHIYLSLVFFYITANEGQFADKKKQLLDNLTDRLKLAEKALDLYKEEAAAYLEQQRQILEGSPFFVSKGDLAGDESTTETKEETVSKKFDIRVRANKGDTLSYEFTTNKDIDFALEYETKGSTTPKPLLPQNRVNSHVDAAKGEYIAPEEGCFVLKWDNSYSWLASKTLQYKAFISKRAEGTPTGSEGDVADFERAVAAADPSQQ